MAKNKKSHRRPGPGKPQGATYAQMLARKAAVRRGLLLSLYSQVWVAFDGPPEE